LKKVIVLLSTYNGAKFVAQQIESILNQTYLNLSIFIRDDGSTDDTLHILNDFVSMYPKRIRLIQGTNIGVVKSFLYLLENSDEDIDYCCFCDQDDIWLPFKTERAVSHLEIFNKECPAMVFTATQLTNSELKPLKVWPRQPAKEPSYYNALIQNIAVGATITLNKEARNLLCNNHLRTDQILMHDWWTYLCISAFGKTYYDPEPSILYRQHEHNVIGGELFYWDKLKRKWGSFQKHKGTRLLYKQAMEFQRLYGTKLDSEKRHQLDLFLAVRKNLMQRIKYLFESKLYRQSLNEQILFRFLILIGYI
jgi:glycosyltransferase involved in cell wall biosynthesis